MKNIINKLILLIGLFLSIVGCKESEIIKLYSSDKSIPKQVLNLTQEGIFGGAILRYDLPDDPNLLYVKAVFTLPNGKNSEVKGSFYSDSLVIEGYGESGTYPAKVYSVSVGEVLSEPVLIDITPLTPPNQAVIDSLIISGTYGGIKVEVNNPTKAQLAISILRRTADSPWQLVTTEYVKLERYSFYVRGQEPIETIYGFVAKDRWENESMIREETITPILEIKCDPTKFSSYVLPTDNTDYHRSFGGIAALWDEGFGEGKQLFVTQPGLGMDDEGALWLTFDMGSFYYLNRYVWWPRWYKQEQYKAGDPKRWEIYGSAAPNPNGSFDESWILLGIFENLPPSGEHVPTAEDREFAKRGIDYMLPEGLPPLRYIRIKFLENYGSNIYTMQEITWYGSLAD